VQGLLQQPRLLFNSKQVCPYL